jgi:hypothetical protein
LLDTKLVMTKELPDDIQKDLERACGLHQRATSDYEKCVEFNKLMSDLLARLEDVGHYRLADRVMTILLDCNPKDGSSCEKASITGERVKKFQKIPVI